MPSKTCSDKFIIEMVESKRLCKALVANEKGRSYTFFSTIYVSPASKPHSFEGRLMLPRSVEPHRASCYLQEACNCVPTVFRICGSSWMAEKRRKSSASS